MAIQLKIVNQWHEIRKTAQKHVPSLQPKPDFHTILQQWKTSRQAKRSLPDVLPSIEEQEAILYLKDTNRSNNRLQQDTRRNFYLSKKKREISTMKDEEFYSKIEGRREQAQKNRILYSNITCLLRNKATIVPKSEHQQVLDNNFQPFSEYLKISKIRRQGKQQSVDVQTQEYGKGNCKFFWNTPHMTSRQVSLLRRRVLDNQSRNSESARDLIVHSHRAYK